MTRVHFYRIQGGNTGELAGLIARLTAKARLRRLDTLIRVDDISLVTALTRQLGDNNLDLFPGDAAPAKPAVDILHGDNDGPGGHHGLLINVCLTIPPWFSRFERIAELVYERPGHIDGKRESFRFYRDRGYPLHFHDLSINGGEQVQER